jgi:hypothetical protein
MSELIESLTADAVTLYDIAKRWEGRAFTLSDALEATMQREGVAGDYNSDAGRARSDLCRHLTTLHESPSAAHRAAQAAVELIADVQLTALEARRQNDEKQARRRMLLHRIGRTTL